FLMLRKGVARSPANATGRVLLARIFAGNRRLDLAQETLLAGLPRLRNDIRYLHQVLDFLLRQGEDRQLVQLAQNLLRSNHLPSQSTTLLAQYDAMAAYYRGHFDQAEDFITRFHLHETATGIVLQAKLDWERGLPELALIRLIAGQVRFPDDEPICSQLGQFYLESGRLADHETITIRLLALNPLSPEPRLAFLAHCVRRRDEPRLAREVQLYLRHFSSQPAALLQLAEFAANTGRVSLARRIHEISIQQRHRGDGPALLLAEALLVDHQNQAALDQLDAFEQASSRPADLPVVAGLRAVALHGLGRWDEAHLQLDYLLAQKNLRAENLLAVARRLAALDARDQARGLLTRAVSIDPRNQAALVQLIRLEIADDAASELTVHLPRLLEMRRPSREVLQSAAATLGSDRHLLLRGQAPLLETLRVQLAAPTGSQPHVDG
ncbi:MAG: tetratricopeptide repeat protein, partial [Terriglobales bacterium]